MNERLTRSERKTPQTVLEWHDGQAEARRRLAIDSLRGGAAGVGTRRRKARDRRALETPAKTKALGFSVGGPAMRGARSGIGLDPADPHKHGGLQRASKAMAPLRDTCCGSGSDLNVDDRRRPAALPRSLARPASHREYRLRDRTSPITLNPGDDHG